MLPVSLTDVLIKNYLREGYTYWLILCFLAGVNGIFISMRTLKRKLHCMGLERKGNYSSTMDVVDCVQVKLYKCKLYYYLTEYLTEYLISYIREVITWDIVQCMQG